VIITSYNQHVRLLSPEPWRLTLPSLLRFREPTFHEIRGHWGFTEFTGEISPFMNEFVPAELLLE
jgi:hypothetical protein